MPLKKLNFKPGVNREMTRYSNEAGWYESDKVRFRQGLPEKIGGWTRISSAFFRGICRSLNSWISNSGVKFIGLGTNLKFYIESGGTYFDVTPIRRTSTAGAVTFAATNGSTLVTVTDTDHGAIGNDFVTYSGAVSLGGALTPAVLNAEFQVVSFISDDSYTINVPIIANASDTGNGGTATTGAYQVNTGPAVVLPTNGWGAGAWGLGAWGQSVASLQGIRLWNQSNFGEDLVYAPSGGPIYYWDASLGAANNRGIPVSTIAGASDVPLEANYIITSDIFRFVFAFGTNLIGSTVVDKMFVRWSDQEDVANWTPDATNQAGSIRLSRGSEIVTAIQARQELLVWTDSALYSFQYVGAPAVWATQIVGNNTSIASQNARAFANGMCFWMGKDGFYMYDGRTQTLRCDIRRYIFDNMNKEQVSQIFAGTVEAFSEVWFYYCSKLSTVVDSYVIYNYVEDVWSYGSLQRSAWLDSGLLDYPIAATYSHNIVEHENGIDDNELNVTQPIPSFIQSGEFDLEDGDRVMFAWRCLPDVNFYGCTCTNPTVNMTFQPRYSSGSPYNDPLSVGGISTGPVTRTTTIPVDVYTGQVDIRVRGRQMSLRLDSQDVGTTWQFGSPRLEIRPDGRR